MPREHPPPQHTPAPFRSRTADALDAAVCRVAETAAWLNLLLIGVILAQVVLRYGFDHGMVPLEELMWHLYATAFMLGLAHGVSHDTHIRVDLLRPRLGEKTRGVIEILGILLLLMPFLLILLHHSLSWVGDSYRVDESSASPQGLPHRWIIKSVIPIGLGLLFLAALARLLRESARLWPGHHGSGN